MYSHSIKIRVRYGETDQMGYLYYGNYAEYFEVGRTETIRSLGVSYKSLEDKGILMPVRDMHIEFLHPAFYDEELTVKTTIPQLPQVRMLFEYEVYNGQNKLLTKGATTLVFIDSVTKRPRKAPEEVLLCPFSPGCRNLSFVR